jgi:flagellar motor switch protein FliM
MLSRLKPARSKMEETAEVVSDLDSIIVNPVAIKWNGKSHILKPITTAEYLKAAEAMARMDALRAKARNDVTVEELVDVYVDVIGSVCDTITKKDILNMTQAQVGALIQAVLDHVTGRIHGKKKLVTPDPTQASS